MSDAMKTEFLQPGQGPAEIGAGGETTKMLLDPKT